MDPTLAGGGGLGPNRRAIRESISGKRARVARSVRVYHNHEYSSKHLPRRKWINLRSMRPAPAGGIMVMVSTCRRNIGWRGGTTMSAEQNKALVRRFLEAHAKGDRPQAGRMLLF